MSSSHASKGGRRWRYYVSRAARTGRKEDAGSIVRVPASEIENRITRAVGTHLAVQAAIPIDDHHINHSVLAANQAIPQHEQTRRRRSRPKKFPASLGRRLAAWACCGCWRRRIPKSAFGLLARSGEKRWKGDGRKRGRFMKSCRRGWRESGSRKFAPRGLIRINARAAQSAMLYQSGASIKRNQLLLTALIRAEALAIFFGPIFFCGKDSDETAAGGHCSGTPAARTPSMRRSPST